MAFPPGFLDELRSRVSLADLVGKRVRLTRKGREYGGLCPFHNEETPSFYVVEDKGFFHCFGCGAHGDAIGFVMRSENLDFIEAIERLAGIAGVAVPQQMDDAAIEAAAQAAIAESGAAGIKDMGKVMAALRERHAGVLDMAKAGGIVKRLLG